jgi:hypothetical protein
LLVAPVRLQPVVEPSGHLPLDDGRAGGERRKDRDQEPHGRVQAGEFAVAVKGKVQVDALQVGPPVPAAVEDPVIRLVDHPVPVRPELRLPGRVHEGVHPRGHQHPPQGQQQRVDFSDVPGEGRGKPGKRGHRTVGLKLHHVEGHLVGPAERPLLDLVDVLARHAEQQLVRYGKDREGLPVHDHVLQLDAKTLEQGEGLFRRAHG